ncbi:AMP-binding protein [Tistrella bauzanensis]
MFFGTQAERRGEMFYACVEGGDLADLPAAMTTFLDLAAARPSEKNNFALFFEPDPQPLAHGAYRDRFWRVLQHLHDHDPAPSIEALETEPDDAAWEFSYQGEQMFAVGCTPSYRQRDSRNLGPGMVILFQPRSLFIDTITKREIGAEARSQVRKRLLAWDGMEVHPDLGVYGETENREWKQYFLGDDNAPETDRCPFLVRRDRSFADTMSGVLAGRARHQPDAPAICFLADGETDERRLTYGGLDARARALAARLRVHADAGDRAMLLLPSGLDYVTAFFACLYAGIIAVPAYPAETGNAQHLARLKAMVDDCAPRLLLTDAAHQELIANLGAVEDATTLIVDQEAGADEAFEPVAATPADIAFLQYTSGSTATPKGVMVSHGNLMANQVLIRNRMGFSGHDIMVSWLPLYHDMGLIGGLLSPIFGGIPLILMAPQHFLERPARWLRAISRHGGTVTGGPDFAYQLCLDRITAGQIADIDLGSLRLAYCGAEPIRPETMAGFRDRFLGAGLDPFVLYPCYGLAEATLLISGGRPGAGATALSFDAAAFAQGRALPVAPAVDDAAVQIDCGITGGAHAVAIVDPATGRRCPDGMIGEIWFTGPSVATGYWRRPDATAETFMPRSPVRGHRRRGGRGSNPLSAHRRSGRDQPGPAGGLRPFERSDHPARPESVAAGCGGDGRSAGAAAQGPHRRLRRADGGGRGDRHRRGSVAADAAQARRRCDPGRYPPGDRRSASGAGGGGAVAGAGRPATHHQRQAAPFSLSGGLARWQPCAGGRP